MGMNMKKLWSSAKKIIVKIGLVDRFLILFMVILLLYTAIGLFSGTADLQNDDMIDTIIRTSTASIFGCFISSNFVKKNLANLTKQSCNRLQVIIVSVMGGCAWNLLFMTKFFTFTIIDKHEAMMVSYISVSGN